MAFQGENFLELLFLLSNRSYAVGVIMVLARRFIHPPIHPFEGHLSINLSRGFICRLFKRTAQRRFQPRPEQKAMSLGDQRKSQTDHAGERGSRENHSKLWNLLSGRPYAVSWLCESVVDLYHVVAPLGRTE